MGNPLELQLEIAKPITLKCGLTLPNRLVKAAMAEGWADKDRQPHADLVETYGLWAEGGWGMILTGNIHIDATYLCTPDDCAVNDALTAAQHVSSWSQWAKVASRAGTPTILQINHPGRQSTLGSGSRAYLAKTVAPSVVPVNLGSGLVAKASSAIVFGQPRALTEPEIRDIVARFAAAARMAHQAGFAGVQIHVAHGYLLAQFLSSKTNKRTDSYGGSLKKRAKIVVDVINAVRAEVPSGFCVGLKINSVDHQSFGELGDCLEQLQDIVDAGVDFLEISGGNYEDPQNMVSTTAATQGKVSPSTAAREAFFLEFAKAVRKAFPDTHLMVTGGFRSRLGLDHAVKSGACDMVGVGRPSVIDPKLPHTVVFNPRIADEDARLATKNFSRSWLAWLLGVKGIAGGTETVRCPDPPPPTCKAHVRR
ncbi:Aldolase-type TIM barrel [Cordyceps fumosorosea ARSEF 2679]|uniref:Aldolase-type TIM barrel n=1 Tax=Cordyceps fumosorosea (strain ARSEF 2679) TaxID=1081104 RepID=A0A167MI56_CORFA|nr:Aldolase-type TIM barrel [Cordyceps fumosorosea ARSEF 2679]OAA54388.1 Aldolase-type TIM barrel [Cordyceps fumosorosea ARSEF 2679]